MKQSILRYSRLRIIKEGFDNGGIIISYESMLDNDLSGSQLIAMSHRDEIDTR
jgi:hypothetical protein